MPENNLENAAKINEKEKEKIKMEDISMDTTEKNEIKENDAELRKAYAERRATKRFYSFLNTIFTIANLSGFRIEGRITVRDLKTGKVFE